MSPRRDLTRWNRAGLTRFRYVDGNAITYLEDLRARLLRRFPDWEALRVESETAAERRARLRVQYEQPSWERSTGPGGQKDWGWEIARAASRAIHVLTEYADVYSNEGYLSTATEWENVRRLVAMLDYHPAPPSSATTSLVFRAKGTGILGAGFAVQHVPSDRPPVVFETLEDLELHPGLNALRPRGAGSNPELLAGRTLDLATEGRGLVIGHPLVLERDDGVMSLHLVESVAASPETHVTSVGVRPAIPSGFAKGRTRAHLRPRDRVRVLGPQAPQPGPTGTSLYLREPPADLRAGDVVHITDGRRAYMRRVRSVRGAHLVLTEAVGLLDTSAATVGRAFEVAVTDIEDRPLPSGQEVRAIRVTGDWGRLLNAVVAKPQIGGPGIVEYTVVGVEVHPPAQEVAEAGTTTLRASRAAAQLADVNPQKLFVPPPGAGPWRTDVVIDRPEGVLPTELETEVPKRMGAGGAIVLARGGQLAGARSGGVAVSGDTARITAVGPWMSTGGGPWFLADTYLYGAFAEEAPPAGWDRNDSLLPAGAELVLDEVPEQLVRGRRVVLASGAETAARVEAVDRAARRIRFTEPLPPGATAGSLVIHANVALAGHGERRPERVLGSGDSTIARQSFVLEMGEVSFVPDATTPSGVRADVEVVVENRVWEQVTTHSDSSPTDFHYAVRMTEDGYPLLLFGDGVRGRRLPTGQNNVRIRFRQGTGLAGLLPAGALVEPVSASPLVDAVAQPLAAAGGNDMEDVASLRDNAPAALLALERAVSVEDLTHLAARDSRVWQALAMPVPRVPGEPAPGAGWNERVAVVVVPSGGGDLSPDLEESLRNSLMGRVVAGVEVSVRRFRAVDLALRVVARVDFEAYEPDAVVEAVRAALTDAFSLRRRKLGHTLYRSDVFTVVEEVAGVESSSCEVLDTFGGANAPRRVERRGATVRAVHPYPDQVVSLPDAPGALEVRAEAAT